MMNASLKTILVTGAHRTGTTWIGKMLAADPSTAYISEPLNALHRPGVMSTRVTAWYPYICEENEAGYLESFDELINFHYHFMDEVRALRSPRDALRMARDSGIFFRARLFRQRPLLKDPFAVFSLAWFVHKLDCQAVVTIRHPAGFASSLKRLNWSFDFKDLLNQPLLMRDHLEPYREEMRSVAADDILGQAALLWVLVYRAVHAIRRDIPSIRIVRHEDFSLDPLSNYRALYNELGLNFTAQVGQTIENSSSSDNPAEVSRRSVHQVRLDSRANLQNWKRRLSADEITRIRRVTEEIAQLYYPEMDWN
jgi:Sulfotransferase family